MMGIGHRDIEYVLLRDGSAHLDFVVGFIHNSEHVDGMKSSDNGDTVIAFEI